MNTKRSILTIGGMLLLISGFSIYYFGEARFVFAPVFSELPGWRLLCSYPAGAGVCGVMMLLFGGKASVRTRTR
ncbi:MAG: hypothetical protein V3T70_01840 [Phycisphaerae bacterium]